MEEKQFDIPIGLFFFNRLDTLLKVFEKIKEIKPLKLYLISDGARESKKDEKQIVESIRKTILDKIDWQCEVKANFSDINLGCKNRMASGISWIFENESKAIILEDDIVPTKDFFIFEKEMLNKYEDNEKIMVVSGFKSVKSYEINETYLFSNHPMIWGWGTWKRAWNKYDINISDWPNKKREGNLKKFYNFFGYIVAKRDFDSVYFHKKDTWDFQWKFIVQTNDGLAIIPKVNLIENIGFGRDDATHTKNESNIDFTTDELIMPYVHPSKIKANTDYDKMYLSENWGILIILKKICRRIMRYGN